MDSRLITGTLGLDGHRRQARRQHARRRPMSWPRRALALAGVLCILAGAAIGLSIAAFYRHSDQVGSSLVHREEQARRAAASAVARGATCTAGFLTTSTPGKGTPVGDPGAALSASAAPTAGAPAPTADALLRAPSIGLVAPVVDGIGADQLSVAVGHVPASSWPAGSGTTVLAAHDVTWFSRIGQLRPGDRISVDGPCATYTYRVTDHRVVSSSTPVYQSDSPKLVLVTCYPLDALFLTSQRYLVDADLVGVARVGTTTPTTTPPAPATPPIVPAPAPLAAQGLGLDHNPAPLGSLSVTGTPSAGWSQSDQPLADEQAVLELYFAALRAAGQDQPVWWAAVAPGVPFGAASPLVGSTVTYNNAAFSPSLQVGGSTLTGAQLTTEPVLSGNARPGLYRISMTATVTRGVIVVTGWTMTPQ